MNTVQPGLKPVSGLASPSERVRLPPDPPPNANKQHSVNCQTTPTTTKSCPSSDETPRKLHTCRPRSDGSSAVTRETTTEKTVWSRSTCLVQCTQTLMKAAPFSESKSAQRKPSGKPCRRNISSQTTRFFPLLCTKDIRSLSPSLSPFYSVV